LKEKENYLVDVVTEWYEKQSAQVQARFDNAVEFLSHQPTWKRPQVGTLTDECEGLIEIRFTADKVERRPLGCYGGEKVFIFLMPEVTERGNNFVPKKACETATKRKDIIKGGKDRVQICEFED